MSTKRSATVRRKTRETDIRVDLTLDGNGVSNIDTGMPFLDHMLELLARHSLVDLTVAAKGDLHVDYHHTVEDIGLTLGEALNKALGNRKGITRYGWSYVPMDEALARVVVDLGGRPALVKDLACRKRKLRDFELSLFHDFFQAFVRDAGIEQFGGQPTDCCPCRATKDYACGSTDQADYAA